MIGFQICATLERKQRSQLESAVLNLAILETANVWAKACGNCESIGDRVTGSIML